MEKELVRELIESAKNNNFESIEKAMNYQDIVYDLVDREIQTHKEKYEKIIHAEVNGILAAKQDLTGCALYVWPMPPCSRCMTVIIQAGISRVVSVIPSTEALQRWGDNFILSSQMAEEAGVELKLIADPFSKTKFDIFNQIHSLLKK